MYSKNIAVSLSALYVLGTLLQLVGFLTPGWDVNKIDDLYQSSGLWFGVTCITDGDCKVKTYFEMHQEDSTSDSKITYAGQVVDEVIATLSIALALSACVLTFVQICAPEKGVVIGFYIVSCTLISASLIWTIIGTIAGYTWAEAAVYKSTTYLIPYSLLLSGVGSLFGLIVATIHIVKLTTVLSSVKYTYAPLN